MNGPVIVNWSATSPLGVGRAAFSHGMAERRDAAAAVDRDCWPVPDERACLVPGFDLRATLGTKGTRVMNRVTGLTLVTVGNLLADLDGSRPPAERTGLILGTTAGSFQSSMDLTRTSLTAQKPFHVESGIIPYAVMNAAAGQCAIWHGLKGPNATLAAGRPSGLLALSYARRLLLAGRAQTVLCGAAEEYSPARSWLDHRGSQGRAGRAVLGEGCAMFAVTATPPASVPHLATVAGVAAMACVDGDWPATVRAAIKRVLAMSGCTADEAWAVFPSGGAGAAGQAEAASAAEMFGPQAVAPPVSDVIGETHAASASFQVAAALTLAANDPAAAGRFAVITSTDHSGTAAAALLCF